MNICMFLMTEFTHDARVTKEARSLINSGHNITVIALNDKQQLSFEKREDFVIRRIKVTLRYILPKGSIFFFIKYIEFVLKSIIKVYKMPFHAYHAHDLETLPIAYILAKINRKPCLYDSHELYIDCTKHNRIQRWVWYQLEKYMAPRTFANIQENDSRGKVFSERYKLAPPTIIRNCQYLNIKKKANRFRDELSISPTDSIILYQGMVTQSRGVDVLIEAMNFIENAVLIIMGQGVYKEKIRKDIKTHTKKDKIFILDPVPWEVLSDYTASADIGVSALQNTTIQHYYALSNKLFEYLSAGLPVVFSNFPEMRKVIVNNNVGLVVDETDPKAFADAITKILKDKGLYKEMSQNARLIIKEKYNWDIEAKKLVNIYKKIEQATS